MERVTINPAFAEAVTVVFSANDFYTPYLATMLQSVIENASPAHNYDLVVLHTSISDAHQRELGAMAGQRANIRIRCLDVGGYTEGLTFYIGDRPNFTAEAYYRLFIPEIFADYHKVIYLDCDMVALRDLADLYETDLDGYLLASSIDYCSVGKYYRDAPFKEYWDNVLMLKNPQEYFISGMLMFNLGLWRETFTLDDMIRRITSYEWKKHDQDILNVLCQGRTRLLDVSWDVMRDLGDTATLPAELLDQVKRAEEQPSIIHFTTSRKPWNSAYVDRYEYFWPYASRTPFLGEILQRMKGLDPYKCFVVQSLLGLPVQKLRAADDIHLYAADLYLGRLSNCFSKLEFMTVGPDDALLEGKTSFMGVTDGDRIEVFLLVNGEQIPCAISGRDANEYHGETLSYRVLAFTCRIPLGADSYRIELFTAVNGLPVKRNRIDCGKYFPVGRQYKKQYFISHSYRLSVSGSALLLRRAGAGERLRSELAYLRELLSSGKKGAKKAAVIRVLHAFASRLPRKPVWIVSDRVNKADDNGEAFFRYLREHHRGEMRLYFAIGRGCEDYQRMKKLGRVVDIASRRHKWLHLFCRYTVSAHADWQNIAPFQKGFEPYRDILQQNRFVFLQHGVIKDDLSRGFNRYNLNMSIFVTAAHPEYRSIVDNPNYGCPPPVTRLTGLPRHDRLYRAEKKKITVMPTWRKYLSYRQPDNPGVWHPRSNFTLSRYFQFYNALINDPRLIGAARTYGYTIQFMPHPNTQNALPLFDRNGDVAFCDIRQRYADLYAESDLVVTDYSSAVMDFAWLRKPVVYCHFDSEEFFAGEHVYVRGYFDYERDGFGEVEYDLDSTVNRVIAYMKDGCPLKEPYRERIDRFFAYSDQQNCRRVYEAIRSLDERQDCHKPIPAEKEGIPSCPEP